MTADNPFFTHTNTHTHTHTHTYKHTYTHLGSGKGLGAAIDLQAQQIHDAVGDDVLQAVAKGHGGAQPRADLRVVGERVGHGPVRRRVGVCGWGSVVSRREGI